ncbi:membrane protease subunit (stomatin/prohibitin family) [Enterococcus sp. PF1-24]|uniref:SPFH domain-containing protein n=1 Tax=unclassified Enterococcus TaxID=2608891 RepID=UPI0024755543|nr:MULTISPECIES: SPFH domain-containing protein [unclassified Enterococcus]MDH6365760.1 membrane protease subunit (stomatin/prohibitin family) [Enterococcus sp. PFB1-1]MDH6402857.1 membrane protease subunit (stomatin/prohibitin family) [Enterococcus sp. PF1-24]
MGLIKSAANAISGGLADQWLEVIEPDDMSDTTVFTKGVIVRKDEKRNGNRKGTSDVITDGSVVHVYPNTMMLLVDGGKVIDYTAEEGYYTVQNASAPSMFNGNMKGAIAETFERFKYGGSTPQKQQVFYINLQEIKGIKFGTATPINYFDNFYNAELFLRAHGSYSIKITDPIMFYANAIPRNMDRVDIKDINQQYLSEFLTALQTAINQMSADGQRISYIPSKSMELSQYMSNVLDQQWQETRGMEIVSVGVASISYTDDSTRLINMRNEGAMLGDANVREGYMQGSIARGLEAAGKNDAGATTGFVGMGMGMNATGGYLNQAAQTNQQQMQNNQQPAAPATDSWACPNCQTQNTGKFCTDCGTAKPVANQAAKLEMKCNDCGEVVNLAEGIPKFCPHCGKPFKAVPLD